MRRSFPLSLPQAQENFPQDRLRRFPRGTYAATPARLRGPGSRGVLARAPRPRASSRVLLGSPLVHCHCPQTPDFGQRKSRKIIVETARLAQPCRARFLGRGPHLIATSALDPGLSFRVQLRSLPLTHRELGFTENTDKDHWIRSSSFRSPDLARLSFTLADAAGSAASVSLPVHVRAQAVREAVRRAGRARS